MICSIRLTGTVQAPEALAGTRNTKGLVGANLLTLVNFGRGGGIRTRDPLHPMQVRYQAALHAEGANCSRGGLAHCAFLSDVRREIERRSQ